MTLNYYDVKWEATATVTQTVGCSADKTRLLAAPALTVTTAYSSDKTKRSVDIKQLDGWFSDADFGMSLTEDGRLKGINEVSTGQGEAIVKSAIGLVAAVAAPMSFTFDGAGMNECDELDKWGGGKGPVTLFYKKTINAATPAASGELMQAAPESAALYKLLQRRLPKVTIDVGSVSVADSRPDYSKGTGGDVVLLTLQRTGFVDVAVGQDGERVGAARLVVPTAQTYEVPIPKAKFFGKQGLTLGLSDAGAVTSIAYTKTTGAAAGLNALTSIAGVEQSKATAQAAELKARADLIAAQQRLVLCQTRPADCK